MIVARLFWIVAGGDMLVLLALAADTWINPHGQFAGLALVMFLAMALLLAVIMVGAALIRRPVAYGIGLALVIWPPVYWIGQYVGQWATTPSESSLAAGHGYFAGAAERALADAIVAGDAAKVAALAPAAKLDSMGWDRMTFMRLALDDGHADPGVVVALLKAGANPEQDQQYLFGSMNDGSGATSGAMITGKNEKLLQAVIEAGVDLNRLDLQGNPRFLTALRWPEGLALMLEHGANTETESKDGKTALMWAVMLWHWPAIDVLLAHGAKVDHVDHEGKALRDLVTEKLERFAADRAQVPRPLADLEARLR
jgi:Ankyrin repeat